MSRIGLRILLVVAAISLNGCASSLFDGKRLAVASPQTSEAEIDDTKKKIPQSPDATSSTRSYADATDSAFSSPDSPDSSRHLLRDSDANASSKSHRSPIQISDSPDSAAPSAGNELAELIRLIDSPDSQLSLLERNHKCMLLQAITGSKDLATSVHTYDTDENPSSKTVANRLRATTPPLPGPQAPEAPIHAQQAPALQAAVLPVAADSTPPHFLRTNQPTTTALSGPLQPGAGGSPSSRPAPVVTYARATEKTFPEQAVASSRSSEQEPSKEVRRGEWRAHAEKALAALEREKAHFSPSGREEEQLAINQRALHWLLNQHDEAVAEIADMNEDEKEYWKHQFAALLIAADADDKHTSSRRAALARRELRDASDHLANMSSLDVRNLAFCEKVESFGRYAPFKSTAFKPGQEVLLYVEIDNFTVKAVGDRFETELQAEYNLIDANGNRTSSKLATVKEEGRNRRHDYFVAYTLSLPKELTAGQYTLQLIVEDVKGQKSSQASLEFKVR